MIPGPIEQVFKTSFPQVSNYDWIEITLNAYRARWLQGEAWDSLTMLRKTTPRSRIFMDTDLQGIIATRLRKSEGLEKFFAGAYRRVVLQNVGHFPHREAPRLVADAVLNHFRQNLEPGDVRN